MIATNNTKMVRVDKTDMEKLMTQGVELFIREHPGMKGMKLSQRFMFHRAVQHFIRPF